MPKELVVLPSTRALSLRGIEAFAAEAPPAMEGRLTLVQPDDQRLLDVRAWRSQIQDCFFMTIGARERGVVSAVCDRGWYRPAGGKRSHCFDVHLVHEFGGVGQSSATQSMRHAIAVHRLATTVTEKRAWLDMLSAAEERFRKHFIGLPVAPVLLSSLAPKLAPLAPPTTPPQKQGGGGGGGGGDVAFAATATAGRSTPLDAYERSVGGGGSAAAAAPQAGSTVSPAALPARRTYNGPSEQFRHRVSGAAEPARLAAADPRVASADSIPLRDSLATVAAAYLATVATASPAAAGVLAQQQQHQQKRQHHQQQHQQQQQ